MYPTAAPPQPIWAQPTPPFVPQQPQPIRLGTAQPPALPSYQHFQAPPNPMTFGQPSTVAPQFPTASAPQSIHSPYFTQYYSPYPGETILERLSKHMLLRIGQILFHELAAFLGLWRWPPK